MQNRRSAIQGIDDIGPVVRECIRSFSAKEVKNAIFSIPGDKSPEPYGYGSPFYKDS